MVETPRSDDATLASVRCAAPEPDWRGASRFLAERLRRLLPAIDPEHVQDLAQEALVDLFRTWRREPIRNVDALLNTLARRKAIDFVRRRDRWSVLLEPLPDDGEPANRDHSTRVLGDPAERLDFVILQLLAREDPGCAGLARLYFSGHSWADVARLDGRSELAVRKQWSRCVAHLRRTLQEHPDALWRWAALRKEADRVEG